MSIRVRAVRQLFELAHEIIEKNSMIVGRRVDRSTQLAVVAPSGFGTPLPRRRDFDLRLAGTLDIDAVEGCFFGRGAHERNELF